MQINNYTFSSISFAHNSLEYYAKYWLRWLQRALNDCLKKVFFFSYFCSKANETNNYTINPNNIVKKCFQMKRFHCPTKIFSRAFIWTEWFWRSWSISIQMSVSFHRIYRLPKSLITIAMMLQFVESSLLSYRTKSNSNDYVDTLISIK